jgi:hypothetical protein
MTRTDVMASSRPRTPGAVRKTRRKLVSLPILLVMGLALLAPTSAFAAEETSGYNQTPTTPTTTATTTPATTPTTGTSPESAEKAPAETTPAKSPEPTTSSSPAKEEAKTLPFTGFDLRGVFAIGIALMIAGFSIVGVQRRRQSQR